MDKEPKDEQATQPQPKPDGSVAEPGTIPIPKRGDFFRDLAKIAKPSKSKGDGESKS